MGQNGHQQHSAWPFHIQRGTKVCHPNLGCVAYTCTSSVGVVEWGLHWGPCFVVFLGVLLRERLRRGEAPWLGEGTTSSRRSIPLGYSASSRPTVSRRMKRSGSLTSPTRKQAVFCSPRILPLFLVAAGRCECCPAQQQPVTRGSKTGCCSACRSTPVMESLPPCF